MRHLGKSTYTTNAPVKHFQGLENMTPVLPFVTQSFYKYLQDSPDGGPYGRKYSRQSIPAVFIHTRQ
jgi:hypothetical protein